MNDRDPFDPIDRTLSNALPARGTSRPMSQPSLIDVRHRARRRQQRRTAGMVAAIVLVGASGVGVYALRHDGGRAALTPGDADRQRRPVHHRGVPPHVHQHGSRAPHGLHRLRARRLRGQGRRHPAIVAQKFAITVDELNAANAGLDGYDAFTVGIAITIPVAQPILQGTTTLPPLRQAAAAPTRSGRGTAPATSVSTSSAARSSSRANRSSPTSARPSSFRPRSPVSRSAPPRRWPTTSARPTHHASRPATPSPRPPSRHRSTATPANPPPRRPRTSSTSPTTTSQG